MEEHHGYDSSATAARAVTGAYDTTTISSGVVDVGGERALKRELKKSKGSSRSKSSKSKSSKNSKTKGSKKSRSRTRFPDVVIPTPDPTSNPTPDPTPAPTPAPAPTAPTP